MRSQTEENYLKTIYKLLEKGSRKISTTGIAEYQETSPASVTDMLKRLSEKKLVRYTPYKGVSLTPPGRREAVNIIRKHRLWEYFLVNKLGFLWDEVHDMAEQLEHIKSDILVEKLDSFLDRPRFDPHGDPIPDSEGKFSPHPAIPLSSAICKDRVIVTGVIDHRPVFLQFLSKNGLSIGKKISIREVFEYDQSMNIVLESTRKIRHISFEVARNILVIADIR